MISDLILFTLGIITVTATILPIIRVEDWWIRIFDFPRIQILVIGIIIIAAFALFKRPFQGSDWLMIMLVLFSSIIQVIRIRPYSPFASKQVLDADKKNPEMTVSMLISNVRMTNRNVSGLLNILKESDPDILLLSEPDKWWEEQLSGIESTYPYSIKYPLDNTYGMLLYSKRKLNDGKVRFLLESDVPSISVMMELNPELLIGMYCLHPKPPRPDQSKDTKKRDAELLLVAKEVKGSEFPVIVMGDLNDVAWSHTTRLFQRISDLLDPRIGRGMYNSFHTTYPFMRFPLDHVFHSNHFKLSQFKRKPHYGSDHFPMYVSLTCETRAQDIQEEPEEERSDGMEADEKVRKAESESGTGSH
ncbi:MAG: endonuclease/exonuclease/phosphatase family protein [Syntrophales bacterium]|jgi:endonuclease/exonuclease/phosphatase (EEP) superfamily protein YafD|nr:endonuclease/exonuclease/phosphatase family protein [Syntrophales bacterium]MDY0045406.1 endonuclease/exonuclease/phosphatase family protein [Syntrophales bacterium]